MLKVIFISLLLIAGSSWAESGEEEQTARFRVLAEQGDSKAQTMLGIMYGNGQGVIQDSKEAAKWFRLAAEQGDSKSQSNLGAMYYYGHGILQDYKLAHMWYNIAAANGLEDAGEVRDEVALEMSSEDISKAQDMAREWVKNQK